MKGADELACENPALRERLIRLNEANLLINESLDFDTGLQRALGYTRARSEALYEMMALLDSSGGAHDILASGITTDEHEQFLKLPEGPEFFERLGRTSRCRCGSRTFTATSGYWAFPRSTRPYR